MYKPYHKKRICPVCGTEFRPRRKTKIYCDDICRRRAFLIRSRSETLSSHNNLTHNNSGKETLNGNSTLTNNESVSDANGKVTIMERQGREETPAIEVIEPFVEKALEERANTWDGEKTEVTENANETITERHANDNVTVKANANETLKDEEWHNAPEKGGFITAISELVDERGYDEKFINPLQYWPRQQAELIGKINKYVRCLLENTLKLSRYRNIPATDLLHITNGYAHVISSKDIENSGHPYGDILKSLHKKLAQLYGRYKSHPKLRLVLSREEKVELIAMLHEIGDTAPLKKFSELFKR
jgi:hypothetical protein